MSSGESEKLGKLIDTFIDQKKAEEASKLLSKVIDLVKHVDAMQDDVDLNNLLYEIHDYKSELESIIYKRSNVTIEGFKEISNKLKE